MRKHPPSWWAWELEITPHLLKRMLDRGFNEMELRDMLQHAKQYRPSASPGRFIVEARHDKRDWEIVVEPDEQAQLLLIITAYRKDEP